MYPGYQGNYSGYNQQYSAAGNSHPYQHLQQQQQQPQNYFGVNPYADYGYGGANQHVPPPPPPPADGYPDEVHPSYRTFPSAPTKLGLPQGYGRNNKNATFQPVAQQGGSGSYNGYDAAVYKYAQNANKWGGGASQGGPRRYGNGSNGNPDNAQHYCETCKISCGGSLTYKEHLEGQRHKKKEAAAKSGVPTSSIAKNKLMYRCELCDITCTGHDTYQAHVRGSKHMKTIALHRKMGKPVPEDVPTILAPSEDGIIETRAKPKWHQQTLPGGKRVIGINTVNFVGGTKLSSTGQIEEKKKQVAEAVSSVGKTVIDVDDEKLKAMIEAEIVQPIGEDQVTEERDATGKLVQFHCKICDCSFSDPNAKDVHVKGRRHRTSYKQKIDPTFIVDQKPSVMKKKQKDQRKSGAKATEVPSSVNSQPMHRGPWFVQASPEGRELNIIDERSIEKKYGTLNPGVEFCMNIDKFVTDINVCLKSVAEKIVRENLGLTEDVPLPTDSEGARTILGVARVGTIATNTYIKGESIAELVLSCSSVPTTTLVQHVKELFQAATTELTITDDISPVSLLITASYFPELPCRLYFTSTAIRTAESSDAQLAECPDLATCSKALAFIRNAKWYDSHCQFLNSCQQVIRLFRDARSRYPEWSILDNYKLELLVANVIDSSPNSLNPAEAFKRVLEAISSGFLYSAILVDPCETAKPNVLDDLTEDQKHSVTCSAQNMLRLIAFNQIHKVLGMERLVQAPLAPPSAAPQLKRPLDTNGNGTDDKNQNQSRGDLTSVVLDEPETKRECLENVATETEAEDVAKMEI